jgi:hypothetical protein
VQDRVAGICPPERKIILFGDANLSLMDQYQLVEMGEWCPVECLCHGGVNLMLDGLEIVLSV